MKFIYWVLLPITWLVLLNSCDTQSSKPDNKLIINDVTIDQHILENGMKVLFKDIPNEDGLVHIHWNVLAGQFNQQKRDSDVAHILEHALFDVAGFDNFEKYMSSLGGYANATTAAHYTSYEFKVKPDKVDFILDIIANWQTLTQLNENKHQVNVDIVLQEWQYRNQSIGEAYSKTYFKKNTHYTGYKADKKKIESIKIEDLFKFYKTWYHPENTHLLIIGNIDKKEMLHSIQVKNSKKWESSVKFTQKEKVTLKNSQAYLQHNNLGVEKIIYNIFHQSNSSNKQLDQLTIQFITYVIQFKLENLKIDNDDLIDFSVDFSIKQMDVSLLNIELYVKNGSSAEVITKINRVFNEIKSEQISAKIMQLAKGKFIDNQYNPLNSNDSNQFIIVFYNQLDSLEPIESILSLKNTIGRFLELIDTKLIQTKSNQLLSEHVFVFIQEHTSKKVKDEKSDNYYRTNLKKYIKKHVKNNDAVEDKENNPISIKMFVPKVLKEIEYTIEYSEILDKNVFSWKLDNGINVQFLSQSKQHVNSKNKFSINYFYKNALDISSAQMNSTALLWSFIYDESSYLGLPAHLVESNYIYRYLNRDQIRIHAQSNDFDKNMNLLYEILSTRTSQKQVNLNINKLQRNILSNPIASTSTIFNLAKNKALYNEPFARTILNVDVLQNGQQIDFQSFQQSRLNTTLQPTLLIVGDLSVEQVHKSINKYITPLITNTTSLAYQQDFINNLKTPEDITVLVNNNELIGSNVTYYIVDKLDVNFELRQARWILAYALYNNLYDEIRSENGLAYAFGVNTAYINDESLLNELSIFFSSSITDEAEINKVTRPIIDVFLNTPMSMEDFNRAKSDVRVNYYNELDIEQFNLNELIYYLKTTHRYDLSIDQALDAKGVTQSITLGQIHELQRDIVKHVSHVIMFETQ